MNPVAADVRLEVHDVLGERVVSIDKNPFTIGRRETNDLRLGGSEVSRDHAEIVRDGARLVLKDKQSRYGTFLNDEPVTSECELRAGDRVRLGRGGGADLVLVSSAADSGRLSSRSGARDDLRQITSLLENFRALGSGRVLQEVLTLVLDAAIDISAAERAFIMLSAADGGLEFRLGRGRGKVTLTDATFAISRKIPEEVYRLGEVRVFADLLDNELADAHLGTVALGIRNVVCVPLNFVQYVETAEALIKDRRIGVLYLDSHEKGQLLSGQTRAALQTLASEASVAIENARLYRDRLEKAKLEQEMRIAAEIQQALLPKPIASLKFVEAAAATIPCRSIGGDFFDYLDYAGKAFGFTLGDVAGKGPPAALLSALMQGMFASQVRSAEGPADVVTVVNQALCRRGIESRFVTLMFGVVTSGGVLTYCNAGHNAPFICGAAGVRRLETGGPVVGLLEFAPYEQEIVTLQAGDTIVIFSDGVSEALDQAGEEFGDDRLLAAVQACNQRSAQGLVEHLVAAVRGFTQGAAQSDDITVMVLKYLGESGSASPATH